MLIPIFIISLLILGAIIYINFERLKPKWTKIGAIVSKLKWWQKRALIGCGLSVLILFFYLSSIYQDYVFLKNFDDFKVRIKFENAVGEIQEYGIGSYDVTVMEGGYVYRLWGDEKRKGDYIPEGQHLGVRYYNPSKFDYETKREIALGEEKPLGKILDCVIQWRPQEIYWASEFKVERDLMNIEHRLSKIPSDFLKSFIVASLFVVFLFFTLFYWSKLKWWHKGALVGLGIWLAILLKPSVAYWVLFLTLPLFPIFSFSARLQDYFGTGTGGLIISILAHCISWIIVGIFYAYIFYTIRRIVKHFQKHKKQ